METDWTIPELLQLSGGYWATCALHAGVRLDIFTAIAPEERTADEVAALCKTAPRATAMLLDALAAMNLLVKSGDRSYRCTRFAAETLAKNSPGYMGHIIMHHHHLMSGWSRLHEALLVKGPPRERSSRSDDPFVRESFLMGMFNLASQLAPRIADALELEGRKRLLDLGGGPGTYAIYFCRRFPGLTAVVYDLPTTREFAERTAASFGLSDRVRFSAGNFLVDPLPTGFDIAWLSHVLHGEGERECSTILSKAVGSLEPGGILLIQEFILNDAKDAPLFPALFSLNMLLNTDSGQSYSQRELSAMMSAAGLTEIRRLSVELPNGAGILSGKKA